MLLGVSSLMQNIFGYFIGVILVSIFMIIKRVYEYDIKKSLIDARFSKMTKRKYTVMFISLYLFCFCFGYTWTAFLISKSITTKQEKITKVFETSCPDCMYKNQMNYDFMELFYINNIFISLTVALGGFILALRSSERTYKELSCCAKVNRYFVKLFCTLQFLIVFAVIMSGNFIKTWDNYAFYQSTLKVPCLIASTLLYVLGPTCLFYFTSTDTVHDY